MHIQPSVAIVILNYNGRHFLQKFLPSVRASTYSNKRIIVADNASTDDSVSWLTNEQIVDEIIVLPTNYGFAKGYNEALKQVKADYFILLNSDVEVTPGWIEPIIALMETDKTIAACQPKILAYDNKDMFEYAGASGGWIDSLGYPFSRGRVFDVCEMDKGQYDTNEAVFWASGAAFFIRANAYREATGFDEFFFAHQEEIDLCWRLQLLGYKIYVCPASKVYHVGGGTLPKGERKAFLNFRNNLIMLYKNLGYDRWWKLLVRMLLDLVSAVQTFLSGNKAFATGIIKAEIAFIKWMFSKKDQNNFTKKTSTNLLGVYKGSIVVQYFLKKKKTFAEIVSEIK